MIFVREATFNNLYSVGGDRSRRSEGVIRDHKYTLRREEKPTTTQADPLGTVCVGDPSEKLSGEGERLSSECKHSQFEEAQLPAFGLAARQVARGMTRHVVGGTSWNLPSLNVVESGPILCIVGCSVNICTESSADVIEAKKFTGQENDLLL
ncbi:hypothetical protein BD779DRAFT_1476340 [Infundibulicybe gibba]|nr:hypothetical protein BD779DRAFT_1476340 [Infundibulicybe gibba]